MIGLAGASLRRRRTTFAATFVSILLGTLVIGAFATLLETSFGAATAADAEVLRILGLVVGGWGTTIVLFSVVSTLTVSVGQRAEELALLRVVGATPGQVRRLIRLEVAGTAVVAAVPGAALALPLGDGVFHLVRRAALVSAPTTFGGTAPAPGLAALAVVATALLAAAITGRRATSGSPTLAVHRARAGTGRLRPWRVVVACLLLGYGVVMAVITVTVTGKSDDPYDAMATSGAGCLLVGVGLATLAPALLRPAARLARPIAGDGASGWLAVHGTARRPHLLGGVLGPVIVLTAGAAGVLVLVGIDHRTVGSSLPEADTINLLNYTVTGMICTFAAVMVVNAYAAVGAGRRPELHRLRVLGATPGQCRALVLSEALLTSAVGTAAGLVASLATIVPFAIARDEGPVPDGQLWLPPVVVVGAVALTVAAAARTLRRTG